MPPPAFTFAPPNASKSSPQTRPRLRALTKQSLDRFKRKSEGVMGWGKIAAVDRAPVVSPVLRKIAENNCGIVWVTVAWDQYTTPGTLDTPGAEADVPPASWRV